MKVKAYAKINLALDVVRKREDGYHELEMVMAPITLHDLIYINTIESGIIIETNSKVMPTDKRNIMYKVVALMKERYGIKKGVKIYVYKHIPTQAGLAGGSADGAAVIKAMNKLFYLNLNLRYLLMLQLCLESTYLHYHHYFLYTNHSYMTSFLLEYLPILIQKVLHMPVYL